MIYDVILVLFVIAMAYFGKKRGLVKTLIGFLSSIIASVLSYFLTPFAVDAIKPTQFYENLVSGIAEKVSPDEINSSAAMPENLSDAVKNAGDKATSVLAEHIAAILVGIAVFFIIIVLLKVIMSLLTNVFELPVLKQINSVGGFVFGLLLSLVLLYVAFAIWGCTTAFETPDVLKETQLARSMFENNLLMIFFVHS
ncbi:MAG: CvpA family protein [Clostridia bacterium]|nr:CvpA family protein [Clostridia bacterium]